MKDNEQITREQIEKVAEILELGRVKYSENIIRMRCPFFRRRRHNFIIDMTTGEYHCNYCGEVGHIRDLGIIIGANVYMVETADIKTVFTNPYLKGTFMQIPFKNKNMQEVLSLTQLVPSLILAENDNKDNFCFIYYFSNLEPLTDHNEIIALRLLSNFKDIMLDNNLSEEEVMKNYSLVDSNNIFYNVIDYYTDEQLNALITLFDKGGNNNGKNK